ncbi:MAG: alpha/beta hydrolase [Rikenellaceae bacterium]|nr:alpha/beta hydrolase [Rikenellaceae bacterium]
MKKITLFTFVFLLSVQAVFSQSFIKETYQFAEKDGQKLYLDRYYSQEFSDNIPCILFMFGGAFARGARDVEKYIPYFDYFVEQGFSVVSIDYRLGLKDVDFQNMNEEQFIERFIHTIDMAVEDMFDATNYILQNADKWNIDKNMIIANGSSAGAVTVLQGEYALRNSTWSSGKLPTDFTYAGVIAFAGAIFTTDGPLKWNTPPSPIMMFHGDADIQVPYGALEFENFGFYGASVISEELENNNYPFWFYSFQNYGHEIASDPMQNNKEDVLSFINQFIYNNQQYMIRTNLKQIGKPEAEKKFDLFDYVRGNFDR